MAKVKLITAGKLDKTGWAKIGKSLLITLGGALIIFLGDITNIVDFGGWNGVAATFLPFIVNFLRKWLTTYESS